MQDRERGRGFQPRKTQPCHRELTERHPDDLELLPDSGTDECVLFVTRSIQAGDELVNRIGGLLHVPQKWPAHHAPYTTSRERSIAARTNGFLTADASTRSTGRPKRSFNASARPKNCSSGSSRLAALN